MGIHLPFVGYVRPSGSSGTRMDPTRKYNNENIASIREFFRCMRAVPRAVLNDRFVLTPENFDRGQAFQDILFETDESDRSVLQGFLRMASPKSLVIPHFDHLFEDRHSLIEEFARTAIRSFIPIISLSEEKQPLTPALMRSWGSELPFKIMENQTNVQNSIKARFAKLGIEL
jgi:hypothetical protein